MQWLQDLNRNKVENLNNIRSEVNKHFRDKKEGISES